MADWCAQPITVRVRWCLFKGNVNCLPVGKRLYSTNTKSRDALPIFWLIFIQLLSFSPCCSCSCYIKNTNFLVRNFWKDGGSCNVNAGSFHTQVITLHLLISNTHAPSPVALWSWGIGSKFHICRSLAKLGPVNSWKRMFQTRDILIRQRHTSFCHLRLGNILKSLNM